MYRFFNLLLGLWLVSGQLQAQAATQITEEKLQSRTVLANKLQEETVLRKIWQLSETEWTRYRTLMKGIRGSISPANISPIEVLGTHARDAQERQKYAEIWARMRHEDAGRILAFQRAYNIAFKKLYGNEKLIDVSKLDLPKPLSFNESRRLLVFVKLSSCPDCERVIQTLLADTRNRNIQTDIYFTDTRKRDNPKIRDWAKRQAIDRERLKNGTITLNHDDGNLFRITRNLASPVPMIFNVTATAIEPINI
jgi:integrating conjugative element protein (TIGR03759 family)